MRRLLVVVLLGVSIASGRADVVAPAHAYDPNGQAGLGSHIVTPQDASEQATFTLFGKRSDPSHAYDAPSRFQQTNALSVLGFFAPQTARGLPGELTVGRNSQTGVDVYHGVDAGKPVYAGITDDLVRRQGQHGSRFVLDQLTPAAGVTRGEAREEALIWRAGGVAREGGSFQNIYHSISPRHSWYQDALDWGSDWLARQGL